MQKFYTKFLFVLLASMLSAASAHADDLYTVDGLKYSILPDGKNVMVYEPATDPSGQLTIPSSVAINGTTYTVSAIDALAFKDCANITSVVLPNTIDSIGYQAFNGCTAMKSINLQDTKLKDLQVSTFLSCKSLESIIIPACVDTIGTNPFMETLSLKSITVAQGNPKYIDIDGVLFTKDKKTILSYPVGKGTDYVIPDGTETIEFMAFCQARTVRNVTIPESVTVIGNNAFMRIDSLQNIKLPSKLQRLGASAFAECKKAAGEIILPSTLTYLGSKAFYYTSITKLEIPGQIKTIPSYVGQNCVKLRTLILHEGSTSIADYAFATCAISELVVPNSVTKIGSVAFEGSTLLKKITLGEKMASIGIRAFNKLNNITEVTCLATTPPTLSGTTTYPSFTATVYSNATLKVPAESINAYKEATNWSAFAKIEAADVSVATVDGDGVKVYPSAEGIHVEAAENSMVEVYNVAGCKVYEGVAGTISVNGNGLYIVRVGHASFKVMI